MKIAVFGGSFDPIHIGHIHAVVEAKIKMDFDKIIFIPVKQSPLKTLKPIEDEHRINMLEMITREYDFMALDKYEIDHERASYTYDTARYLKTEYPNDALYFLMGWDQYLNFDRWYKKDELLELMHFVVLDRIGEGPHIQEPFIQLNQPVVEVSSTVIRSRIMNNDPVRHQLDAGVFKYIKEHGLYES
ncbi:nicotinate (nicotinamide) nucleotide adenylyltransferase [Salinicoccus albus]|uniref:nicotinate (nicotinamide) nucleotide adenylyltransferase n=1 Tax=Salinicoccus albus TaxID=418756 RepID=UPI000371C8EF|nr:nicotinate (nicotinamide) nucleotide adenylyltransferase [Salinicoccus albus]